jgi:branched-chain amino acid transport system permease protein
VTATREAVADPPVRPASRAARAELRLLPRRSSRVGVAIAIVAFAGLPLLVSDDFWMTVLISAGIFAMGAIGLNLLTGFTGQVSLGHAFFLGAGGYTVAYLGDARGWPLPVWLLAAGVVGGVIGAVVGPFALRLKGNYLVVVTLALVFIGTHIFENWNRVTGGSNGTAVSHAKLSLGFTDFEHFSVPGKDFTELQGLYYLVWILVALFVIVSANIVRTRPGRALQAIRDRDVAAEIVGISQARYKVGAFVVSSAMAAMAGALLGVQQTFLTPGGWNIFLSIQYVAVIIVGGVGTISGPVLGALFLGPLQEVIKHWSGNIPLLKDGTGTGGGIIDVNTFNQLLFGVLLILFLLFEPRGLAALWQRLRGWITRRRTAVGRPGTGDMERA